MEGAPGAREGKCIIPHDALTSFKDTHSGSQLPFFFLLTIDNKEYIIAASTTFTLPSRSLAPYLLLWCATVSKADLCVQSAKKKKEKNVNIASVSWWRLLVTKRIGVSNHQFYSVIFSYYCSKQPYWLIAQPVKVFLRINNACYKSNIKTRWLSGRGKTASK